MLSHEDDRGHVRSGRSWVARFVGLALEVLARAGDEYFVGQDGKIYTYNPWQRGPDGKLYAIKIMAVPGNHDLSSRQKKAGWRRASTVISGRSRITVAPGWRLLRVLSWVYSQKTMNGVFRPTILDMQHEHMSALAEGRPAKAAWKQITGYGAVASTVLAQMPVSLIKLAVKWWKAAS